ncbi:stage III sporulation protein AH [Clostridium sp. USBA 49]|uniref:SpoIIIAH-like family protein n=1 Tax=Clostridium TaxID=1485 RepID=UPI00099AF06E|nr:MULTISPECIES: SpoIIIAH-like family protein [Clostridium]SKA76794.1 stage III sporulation protein AH [Clostridium sp. USBA 49]
MNKKQAFIIATLLVLIVCAGVLATKVNSPLYVDSQEVAQDTKTSSKTGTKDNFFTEMALNRQQTYANTVPTYKSIIDDPNTPKDTREATAEKLNTFTMNNSNEQKIEAQLKGKGYEESFCQISENKVTVYVKADKEKFTDKNARDIKNIVLGITKIKDVEIALK